jgi:hypothetical protein
VMGAEPQLRKWHQADSLAYQPDVFHIGAVSDLPIRTEPSCRNI